MRKRISLVTPEFGEMLIEHGKQYLGSDDRNGYSLQSFFADLAKLIADDFEADANEGVETAKLIYDEAMLLYEKLEDPNLINNSSNKTRNKSESTKKTSIKVTKIIEKQEFWTKCNICGHKLKKALLTDRGTIGYDCYLTQLGFPPKTKAIKLADLPDQAFEDYAETVISQINDLKPQERLKAASGSYYFDEQKNPVWGMAKISHAKTLTPIHVRFKLEESFPGLGKAGSVHVSNLLTDSKAELAMVLGIDKTLFERVLKTKRMNEYYRKQAGELARILGE